MKQFGWLKANSPFMGPGPVGGMPSVEGFSKGFLLVFTRVSEKTTETSEQLGRQARAGFKPGTSRLPVSSVTTLPLVGFRKMVREISMKMCKYCLHSTYK